MSKDVFMAALKACDAFEEVRRDIEKVLAADDEDMGYLKNFFEAMRSLKQSLEDL